MTGESPPGLWAFRRTPVSYFLWRFWLLCQQHAVRFVSGAGRTVAHQPAEDLKLTHTFSRPAQAGVSVAFGRALGLPPVQQSHPEEAEGLALKDGLRRARDAAATLDCAEFPWPFPHIAITRAPSPDTSRAVAQSRVFWEAGVRAAKRQDRHVTGGSDVSVPFLQLSNPAAPRGRGTVGSETRCQTSGQDPAFSAVIHDKLQVPNTIRKAWNDKDNRCDICATHLNQLKQEAIQMVLTLEQAAGSEHYDGSPGSPPALSNMPALVGSRHTAGLQQPRDWAFVPASYASSNYTAFVTNKHSGKPNSLGVSNGAEKKSGSPTHQAKVSLQMATSPSNGNILNSVAIQAHQYLDGTWSLSRTNGVTLYPYQISQLMTETGREGLTEAALNRYNADKPSACSVPASQASCVASETSTGASVAASFFARAAQKLNLSSKKKKHRPSTSSVAEPPLFATSFSGILQTCPPPAPPCLLRAVSKVKDTPGLGKTCPLNMVCPGLPSGKLQVWLKAWLLDYED
ncbi:kinesin-like protein KIF26B [Crocuta crocuta]